MTVPPVGIQSAKIGCGFYQPGNPEGIAHMY
jgi:hypothetical protein